MSASRSAPDEGVAIVFMANEHMAVLKASEELADAVLEALYDENIDYTRASYTLKAALKKFREVVPGDVWEDE